MHYVRSVKSSRQRTKVRSFVYLLFCFVLLCCVEIYFQLICDIFTVLACIWGPRNWFRLLIFACILYFGGRQMTESNGIWLVELRFQFDAVWSDLIWSDPIWSERFRIRSDRIRYTIRIAGANFVLATNKLMTTRWRWGRKPNKPASNKQTNNKQASKQTKQSPPFSGGRIR